MAKVREAEVTLKIKLKRTSDGTHLVKLGGLRLGIINIIEPTEWTWLDAKRADMLDDDNYNALMLAIDEVVAKT